MTSDVGGGYSSDGYVPSPTKSISSVTSSLSSAMSIDEETYWSEPLSSFKSKRKVHEEPDPANETRTRKQPTKRKPKPTTKTSASKRRKLSDVFEPAACSNGSTETKTAAASVPAADNEPVSQEAAPSPAPSPPAPVKEDVIEKEATPPAPSADNDSTKNEATPPIAPTAPSSDVPIEPNVPAPTIAENDNHTPAPNPEPAPVPTAPTTENPTPMANTSKTRTKKPAAARVTKKKAAPRKDTARKATPRKAFPPPAPVSTRLSRNRKVPERLIEQQISPEKKAPKPTGLGSKVFEPTYITTNSNSRLAKVKTDVYHMLLEPSAWDSLSPAQKIELIKMLPQTPANTAILTQLAAKTTSTANNPESPNSSQNPIDDPTPSNPAPTPRPRELSSCEIFRTDVAKYQSDLRNGYLAKGWQASAHQAMKDRAAGKFDEWKAAETEAWWGQKSEPLGLREEGLVNEVNEKTRKKSQEVRRRYDEDEGSEV